VTATNQNSGRDVNNYSFSLKHLFCLLS